MRNTSGDLSPVPRLPSLFWNTAADPPLCRASRKAGILQQGSLSVNSEIKRAHWGRATPLAPAISASCLGEMKRRLQVPV